jgi:indolepyruvate decarboxylase
MLFSDVDVGFDPTGIARRKLIQATADGVSVSHHRFPGIPLAAVLEALLRSDAIVRRAAPVTPGLRPDTRPAPGPPPAWGTAAVIHELNGFLKPSHVVLADTGDCLFASVELRADRFIAPGYYASMGLAVPGAIGAQAAWPDARPVVLVGDGAFKMTGAELGTAADYGFNPIVVVLNNRSFATLRAADGNRDRDYYRVREWDYVGLARCLGGDGMRASNAAELRAALRTAEESKDFFVIDTVLPEGDASPTLQRLGREYGGRIRMGG